MGRSSIRRRNARPHETAPSSTTASNATAVIEGNGPGAVSVGPATSALTTLEAARVSDPSAW
jgi:hypothetical protein